MSADDEHLRHIICQHLTGVTYVDSRLYVRETKRVTEVKLKHFFQWIGIETNDVCFVKEVIFTVTLKIILNINPAKNGTGPIAI